MYEDRTKRNSLQNSTTKDNNHDDEESDLEKLTKYLVALKKRNKKDKNEENDSVSSDDNNNSVDTEDIVSDTEDSAIEILESYLKGRNTEFEIGTTLDNNIELRDIADMILDLDDITLFDELNELYQRNLVVNVKSSTKSKRAQHSTTKNSKDTWLTIIVCGVILLIIVVIAIKLPWDVLLETFGGTKGVFSSFLIVGLLLLLFIVIHFFSDD